MTDVVFPVLSEEKPNAEGVLATWYVADGEEVTADQLLGEAQVDKVDAEIFAPVGGVIQLLVAEDEAVVQGTPVARIM